MLIYEGFDINYLTTYNYLNLIELDSICLAAVMHFFLPGVHR